LFFFRFCFCFFSSLPFWVFRIRTSLPNEHRSTWEHCTLVRSRRDPVQRQVQRYLDSSLHLCPSFTGNFHQSDVVKSSQVQTYHCRVWHWRFHPAKLLNDFHSDCWLSSHVPSNVRQTKETASLRLELDNSRNSRRRCHRWCV